MHDRMLAIYIVVQKVKEIATKVIAGRTVQCNRGAGALNDRVII